FTHIDIALICFHESSKVFMKRTCMTRGVFSVNGASSQTTD
uniref:Uncharacterized protein n=1 Tax=Aegilops tauschii subsp. strangulata TaxID=200361 RepID=A0A453L033_AEGTS